MSEKGACKGINSRTVRIGLVDGTQINACVNIDREPGYDRLSDLISSDRDSFLVLMNSIMYTGGLNSPEKHDTLFINKRHILWATPDEESL